MMTRSNLLAAPMRWMASWDASISHLADRLRDSRNHPSASRPRHGAQRAGLEDRPSEKRSASSKVDRIRKRIRPRKRRTAPIVTVDSNRTHIAGVPDLSDSDVVRRIYDSVHHAIHRDAGIVVLDLRMVERADTKIVAALLALVRQAAARNVEFQVMTSPAVRLFFRMARIDLDDDRLFRLVDGAGI